MTLRLSTTCPSDHEPTRALKAPPKALRCYSTKREPHSLCVVVVGDANFQTLLFDEHHGHAQRRGIVRARLPSRAFVHLHAVEVLLGRHVSGRRRGGRKVDARAPLGGAAHDVLLWLLRARKSFGQSKHADPVSVSVAITTSFWRTAPLQSATSVRRSLRAGPDCIPSSPPSRARQAADRDGPNRPLRPLTLLRRRPADRPRRTTRPRSSGVASSPRPNRVR